MGWNRRVAICLIGVLGVLSLTSATASADVVFEPQAMELPPPQCDSSSCAEGERDARGCCPSAAARALAALRQRLGPAPNRRAGWIPAFPIPPVASELPEGPAAARASLREAIDARRNTGLTAFVTQHADAPALVARARFELARRQRGNARRWRAALEQIVASPRMQPGSPEAELVALARLQLADEVSLPEMRHDIRVRRPRTMEAFTRDLLSQIQEAAIGTQRIAERYTAVMAYRSPPTVIFALARQGQAYDSLVRSVAAVEPVMPADLRRQSARAPASVREEINAEFVDRTHQVLGAQMAPAECFAVVRYMLAHRATRASGGRYAAQLGDLPSFLRQRLQLYGEERLAECVTARRAEDPTMQPYRQGELDE